MKIFRKGSGKSDDKGNDPLQPSEERLFEDCELEIQKALRAKAGRREGSSSADPKRLLCFNKPSREERDDSQPAQHYGVDTLPKFFGNNSSSIVEYECHEHPQLMEDDSRDIRDSVDDGDELCDSYYEGHGRQGDHPIILTAESAEILAALSRDDSKTSYAPVRKFSTSSSDSGRSERQRQKLHHAAEQRRKFDEHQRWRQRQQRSLVDDLSTCTDEHNPIEKEMFCHLSAHIHRHLSNNPKVASKKKGGSKDAPSVPEAKKKKAKKTAAVVDAKEKGFTGDENSVVSRVSSLSSASGTIATDSVFTISVASSWETQSVILSPRVQSPTIDKQHSSRSSRSHSSKRNQNYIRRSESVIYSNLDTIDEGEDSYREIRKPLSSSSSIYSTSASDNDSYYRSENEEEPPIFYASQHLKSRTASTSKTSISSGSRNSHRSFDHGPVDKYFEALGLHDSNSGAI